MFCSCSPAKEIWENVKSTFWGVIAFLQHALKQSSASKDERNCAIKTRGLRPRIRQLKKGPRKGNEGRERGIDRGPWVGRFKLNFGGNFSVLGKWGRTQMGPDGFNRILPFQPCQGTPCTSENTRFQGISTRF